MPPKRSQRLKRKSSGVQETSAPRRRGRPQTLPPAPNDQDEHEVDALPNVVASHPPSTVNAFPPDLVQSLVSTVTAEVTKQLSAILPALSPAATTFPSSSTAGYDTATMLVNGAVASAHASIAGQEPQLFTPANNVTPQQVFRSASLSIDSRVSDKLKFKIWNEEFVEFGSLLSNPGLDDKYQVSFQKLDSGKPASFCLEPASKPRKIQTIDNWLRAFHIFVGVYTQKHPSEAPALMKYAETIQDLAARGQNWRFYDENFRFLRQTVSTLVPWETIHWELWFRSQYPQAKKFPVEQQNTASPRQRPSSVPTGYCFKFHRGTFCSGCEFKHTCFKCQGNHRASQCGQFFRNSSGKSLPSSNRNGATKSPATNTSKT